MTTPPPNAQFKHVGIYVRDLEGMADFYNRLLGLVITDRGTIPSGAKIIFLSRSPDEHHQLVLVEGRHDGMGEGLINQLSFRLDSLQDLKTLAQVIEEQGVRVDRAMNHGNAWSIYCFDPEGNRLELYTGSPWYIAQPCAEDLDLSEDVATIMAKTEAMVRADPTFSTKEDWNRKQAAAVGAG